MFSNFLFEAFSHIMRIFGSVEPQTESTSPFLDNIKFETYQSLEPPKTTLEGGKHVHPLTFLYRFNAQQLLFKGFLDIMRIFSSIKP